MNRIQQRQQKTEPANLEIVSLVQAKLYLRETRDDQDDNISLLIAAAVQFMEAGLDYFIDTDETIYQYCDNFYPELYIWHRHISATDEDTTVEYWDGSSWIEVSPEVYRLSSSLTPPTIFLRNGQAWPTPAAEKENVRIGFKLDTTHSFLDDIRGAILTLVASNYENAEGIIDVPKRVTWVIDVHRMHS